MSEKKKLLRLRERMKKNTPEFVRCESWRYKRVKKPWRRPRGIDSRIRRKEKGIHKSPNVGYRKPRKVRGLHPTGYKEVVVHNINELHKLDPKLHIATISSTVGKIKRSQMLLEAEDLNILVSNPGKLQPSEETLPVKAIAEEETVEEEKETEETDE
jgi:large subunit ribosomal protein L32e